MNGMSDKKDVLGLSNMNPQLIHRVLATDPSQFSSLTVSGKTHCDETPAFQDFVDELKPSPTSSMESVMKRAYRDNVCDAVYNTRNINPLQQLLLDVHQALRGLVPNRSDLHSVLKDDEVRETTVPIDLLPFAIQAGEALAQLESAARSERTQQWLKMAKADDIAKMDLKPTIEFLVNSMLYLLRKAELCDEDKQNFYLATVWAPRIHQQGHEFERQAFQARYGKFDDDKTAPLTKQWIHELVAQCSNRGELDVMGAREMLFKKGWIEDILFRGGDRPPLSMPEVLALDLDELRSIRLVTRSAAAGSALALHACNAGGMNPSVLSEPIHTASQLESRRLEVAEAMANRDSWKTREEYEENVANAVVQLAKEWNPLLDSETEVTLRSRTSSVLRGEDPVIRLLDSRMKEVFTALLGWKPSLVNVEMRSGLAQDASRRPNVAKAFHAAATMAFCKRGLSFYASDLASASYLAKQVVDLAWKDYGDCFLDKIIRDACQS